MTPAPAASRIPPAFVQPHAEARRLSALRQESKSCERCDLYKNATQTVFGEGAQAARVMLVGEQPGDREDIAGRPFVGSAGKLLDECLHEDSVDRSLCFVTNAVKHFKFEPRGKRRMHAKPSAGEEAHPLEPESLRRLQSGLRGFRPGDGTARADRQVAAK